MPTDLAVKAADVNLYEVLDLPSPSSTVRVSVAQIKSAYRTALLKHHPDKIREDLRSALNKGCYGTPHTIDLIALARSTLLSPSLRAEYDRSLLMRSEGHLNPKAPTASFQDALEAVDLDELQYSDKTRSWSRQCRCGNVKAFELAEEDLEAATLDGTTRAELVVGCGGCSIRIRVAFEVAEDNVEEASPSPVGH